MVAADPSAVRARGGDGQTAPIARPPWRWRGVLPTTAPTSTRATSITSPRWRSIWSAIGRRWRGTRPRALLHRHPAGAALGDTAVAARHLFCQPVRRPHQRGRDVVSDEEPSCRRQHLSDARQQENGAHDRPRVRHADVEQFPEGQRRLKSLTMACELGDDERVSADRRASRAGAGASTSRRHPHHASRSRNREAVKRMLAIDGRPGTVDRGGPTAPTGRGFTATGRRYAAGRARAADSRRRAFGHAARLGALGISARLVSPAWRLRGHRAGDADAGATPPEITDALVASDDVRVLAGRSEP